MQRMVMLSALMLSAAGQLAAQVQTPDPAGVYDVAITTSDGQTVDARIMVKGEPGKYEGTFFFAGLEEALPLDTVRLVGNELQIGVVLPGGNGHRFFNLTPVTADSFVGKVSGGPGGSNLAAKKVR